MKMSNNCIYLMVQKACETLNERLAPIKAANPTGSWFDWIAKAYMERIALSAAELIT